MTAQLNPRRRPELEGVSELLHHAQMHRDLQAEQDRRRQVKWFSREALTR